MAAYLLAQTKLGNIDGIGTLGNIAGIGGGIGGYIDTFRLLERFISNIIGALTVVASLWFMYQIIMSGITWISSNGDKQNLQNAQKRFINSFLGLLIAVSAYVLTALVGRFLGIPGIFDLYNTLYNMRP